MRILHVIPQFPYFGGRTVVGGHASCLLALALAQGARGDKVTILTYVHGRAGTIPVAENVEAVSLFENATPGTVGFGIAFLRACASWAKARRGEFDALHGHSGFADYITVTSRLRRVLRMRCVHTLYCPIAGDRGRWATAPFKMVIRRAARRVDVMTAMSENVRSSIEAYGLGEAMVVTPGIDLERFHPGPTSLREELGIGAEETIFLFVGNATKQKNLHGVLEAFGRVYASHPETRLVITTELKQSSSDERLEALRCQMEALGIADAIVQLGIVDNMAELVRACDVLVAPFMDSIGPSDYFMAVLEAMASGKPTIVSRVGGMPEVIDDSVGRLVDPADSSQIAGAMDELAGDAALRHSMGTAARALAEARFDPTRAADRYADIYASISGAGR
jgi:glycosyltransferase involved in cell wall biosynthesis